MEWVAEPCNFKFIKISPVEVNVCVCIWDCWGFIFVENIFFLHVWAHQKILNLITKASSHFHKAAFSLIHSSHHCSLTRFFEVKNLWNNHRFSHTFLPVPSNIKYFLRIFAWMKRIKFMIYAYMSWWWWWSVCVGIHGGCGNYHNIIPLLK